MIYGRTLTLAAGGTHALELPEGVYLDSLVIHAGAALGILLAPHGGQAGPGIVPPASACLIAGALELAAGQTLGIPSVRPGRYGALGLLDRSGAGQTVAITVTGCAL